MSVFRLGPLDDVDELLGEKAHSFVAPQSIRLYVPKSSELGGSVHFWD